MRSRGKSWRRFSKSGPLASDFARVRASIWRKRSTNADIDRRLRSNSGDDVLIRETSGGTNRSFTRGKGILPAGRIPTGALSGPARTSERVSARRRSKSRGCASVPPSFFASRRFSRSRSRRARKRRRRSRSTVAARSCASNRPSFGRRHRRVSWACPSHRRAAAWASRSSTSRIAWRPS